MLHSFKLSPVRPNYLDFSLSLQQRKMPPTTRIVEELVKGLAKKSKPLQFTPYLRLSCNHR